MALTLDRRASVTRSDNRATSLRAEAVRIGRSPEDFDLSVLTGFDGFEAVGMEKRVRELNQLGFQRMILVLETAAPDAQWPRLDQLARLVKRVR
jgi:hypothetical protein